MSTTDNTENPKEYLGREKPCIQYIPMAELLKVAEVFRLGAAKYGQKNWRVQPVRMSTYYNAMFRHMIDWFEKGEEQDIESTQHHLAHVIADALIMLDGITHKSIMDDRAFTEVKTGKLAEPDKVPYRLKSFPPSIGQPAGTHLEQQRQTTASFLRNQADADRDITYTAEQYDDVAHRAAGDEIRRRVLDVGTHIIDDANLKKFTSKNGA